MVSSKKWDDCRAVGSISSIFIDVKTYKERAHGHKYMEQDGCLDASDHAVIQCDSM
jgi:hypothetical protein